MGFWKQPSSAYFLVDGHGSRKVRGRRRPLIICFNPVSMLTETDLHVALARCLLHLGSSSSSPLISPLKPRKHKNGGGYGRGRGQSILRDSAPCCTLKKQAKSRLDDKRWVTLDVSEFFCYLQILLRVLFCSSLSRMRRIIDTRRQD